MDLVFTRAYVGVVVADQHTTDDHFRLLESRLPKGIAVWYYGHVEGSLWIATADEHADSVTTWLHEAHRAMPCTTTLAVLLDNGMVTPPIGSVAYFYRMGRKAMVDDAVQFLKDCFAIYLLQSDEFLIISEIDHALARHSKSTGLPHPITVHRQHDCVSETRVRLQGAYDPLDAQIGEVLGPITDSAKQAAADLAIAWTEHLNSPVADDVQNMETLIEEERQRLLRLRRIVRHKRSQGDFIVEIDRYAQLVRSLRWNACDLRGKIREYKRPGWRNLETYEDAVTPLILRALHRYTNDIVEQLGLNGVVFVPVIGRDFATCDLAFAANNAASQHGSIKTVILEVPGETRLRLGALPMIVRAICSALTERLGRVVLTLGDVERPRNPSLDLLLPTLKVRDGHPVVTEVERHQHLVSRVAKEIAADLLATAVAGPPFVFAMARFAVGQLGEVDTERLHRLILPSFRTRLRACLGMLAAMGIQPGFHSAYLGDGPLELPDEVVDVVIAAAGAVYKSDEKELEKIRGALAAGRIVRARPTAILTALWRAVAERSGYLHEVAALMSIAD